MVSRARAGAEMQSITTSSTLGAPDGAGGGTTAPVLDAATKRSGQYAYKCAGTTTGTSILTLASTPSATDSRYRLWCMVDALPTATVRLWEHNTNGANPVGSVRLKATGKIALYNAAGTQVGADSADAVTPNVWFCLLPRLLNSATANADVLEVWLGFDGVPAVQVAQQTGFSMAIGPNQVQAGWLDAPGTTANLWLDDYAWNDTTTGYANTWPEQEGRVLLCLPVRPLSKGTWTTDKNTTTDADFLAAIDAPPDGIADTTASAGAHQLRSGASSGTDAFEFEFRSLGRVGVPGHVFVDTATGAARALGDAAARTRQAQGYYLAGTHDYTEVFLRKVGSPTDDVVLELQADSGGSPDGTVLQTYSVAGSSLTGSFAAVAFLHPAQPLTVGVKYKLVLRRSGAVDAANYYEIELAGGNGYYDGATQAHNGTSWGAEDPTTAWRCRAYHSIGNATLNTIYAATINGEAIATGTKQIKLELTLPTGLTGTLTTVGGDLGAAGTYPTNWQAYAQHGSGLPVPSMALMPRARITKTDTTTRVALTCFLGVLVDYSDPVAGWRAFTKTADATTWWAKRCATATTGYYDNAGTPTPVPCQAGDWLITPDPLPGEGVMLTSLASETDANIKANYTPV
jgi:hypothetical protein